MALNLSVWPDSVRITRTDLEEYIMDEKKQVFSALSAQLVEIKKYAITTQIHKAMYVESGDEIAIYVLGTVEQIKDLQHFQLKGLVNFKKLSDWIIERNMLAFWSFIKGKRKWQEACYDINKWLKKANCLIDSEELDDDMFIRAIGKDPEGMLQDDDIDTIKKIILACYDYVQIRQS